MGASGAVRLTPDVSGLRFSLTLIPPWGNAANSVDRLWSARDANELGLAQDFEPDMRLEAELGSGFALPRTPGVVTPYTGFSAERGENRTVRTGALWTISPEATLKLEAACSEGANDNGNGANHRIGLEGKLLW